MSTKTWEVELKFHVDSPDVLESKLVASGFRMIELQQHEDIYLRHPSRDFAQTDEAFRIRRVNDRACVTYKGPRALGPVKTREELELGIDHSELAGWQALMGKLGFQQVVPVRKSRRLFAGNPHSESTCINVMIDRVEQLGDFAEIEMVVTEPNAVSAAELQVLALANQLGLEKRQPRSYLSMLLEKLGQ